MDSVIPNLRVCCAGACCTLTIQGWREEVHVRTGAWLLIGIGSALVIVTLLLVFIIPSGTSAPPAESSPRDA